MQEAGRFAGAWYSRAGVSPLFLRGILDQQAERIHAILSERQGVVDQMWQQLRPEVQKAMLEVHSEIADLLRSEQRRRFHEWLMQQRSEQSAARKSDRPQQR